MCVLYFFLEDKSANLQKICFKLKVNFALITLGCLVTV